MCAQDKAIKALTAALAPKAKAMRNGKLVSVRFPSPRASHVPASSAASPLSLSAHVHAAFCYPSLCQVPQGKCLAGAQIDAADLVPGDVVLVRLGDVVPADIKLLGEGGEHDTPMQVRSRFRRVLEENRRFSEPFCLRAEARSSARVPMLQLIFVERHLPQERFPAPLRGPAGPGRAEAYALCSLTLQGTPYTVCKIDSLTSSICKVCASDQEALLQQWTAQ